jgi:hypothetical protein
VSDLLGIAIEAHGGLQSWSELRATNVKASIRSAMRELKGKGGVLGNITIDITQAPGSLVRTLAKNSDKNDN